MNVKIYTACCGGDNLVDAVNQAVSLAGVDAQVETVSDIAEVVKAGIMSTPAIKINDRLVSSGKTPKVKDLVKMLTNAAAKEA